MFVATFGESQQSFLLPGVQTAMRGLRAEARALGIETEVANYGGARTETIVRQLMRWRDEAVARGEPWYRVSPYTFTKHGLGGAEDLNVTRRPAGMTRREAYAKLGALCTKHGLIWGGTFAPKPGEAEPDIYHFESRQSIAQLRPRWEAWIKSPEFPRTGWIDPEYLLYFALAILVVFLLFRAIRHVS